MTSIWWIRRDLRLTDNAALQTALDAAGAVGSVIPTFVIDPAFSDSSPRRKDFLYEGLHALDKDLRARGSYLVVRSGQPFRALRKLLADTKADVIVAEEDFTPYARKRDREIADDLPLQVVSGQTVHHPASVLKADGTPYKVYTAYTKIWKSRLPSELKLLPAPRQIPTPTGISSEPLPAYRLSPMFPSGEQEALVRLEEFLHQNIYSYEKTRDRMDLEGTSALSPYFRFGMLGLRQAVHSARQAIAEARGETSRRSAETWLSELIWREFYIQILYHFPFVSKQSFNPSLKDMSWRNQESDFEAWKEGRTGIPVVDAAMRQLKEIGWMHNRARMIVASYLIKNLLIDWRWGEAWFMENLLDGDLSANNGGWQWSAGTGPSSAPYFRIFNPILQSPKFDPQGDYIRKWVRELRDIDAKDIHAPWKSEVKRNGYPEHPIAECHKEQTLQVYREAKRKWSEHVANETADQVT